MPYIYINNNFILVDKKELIEEAEFEKIQKQYKDQLTKQYGELYYDRKEGKVMYRVRKVEIVVEKETGKFQRVYSSYSPTNQNFTNVEVPLEDLEKYTQMKDSGKVVIYDLKDNEFKVFEPDIENDEYYNYYTGKIEVDVEKRQAKYLKGMGTVEEIIASVKEHGFRVTFAGENYWLPFVDREGLSFLISQSALPEELRELEVYDNDRNTVFIEEGLSDAVVKNIMRTYNSFSNRIQSITTTYFSEKIEGVTDLEILKNLKETYISDILKLLAGIK